MAIVYCSENQTVSRVMLVLQWPNVPVSMCKRISKVRNQFINLLCDKTDSHAWKGYRHHLIQELSSEGQAQIHLNGE